jgi:putative protease
MISRIDDLHRAGVISAKIEGRMKRPEYVAAASHACRLSADGQPIPQDLLQNLDAVFSRSGFTTGYLDGKLGRDMFGVRSKENVTGATSAVFSELHGLYHNEYQKIPLHFILTIQKREPVRLQADDGEGNTVTAVGDLPEEALNRPIDEERCTEQLKKTGGTPFFVEHISCEIGSGLSIPISMLNKLRRSVLEQLEETRGKHPPIAFTMCQLPQTNDHMAKKKKLRARFSNSDLPESAKQCELIYLPYDTDFNTIEKLKQDGYPIALELPRGMFGMERAVRNRLETAKSAGITDVWAGNLGAAALGKELDFTVHGGFSLNITNSAAMEWYREFGLADTELSFELTLPQAAEIGGKLRRGLLVYGRLPLMLTRNCPAANAGGCQNCKTAPMLTDRKGIQFPIQCTGACSEVLNSVPLYMADRIKEIRNQDFGVLRFTTETVEETDQIIAQYLAGSKGSGEYTRGLYYRGIE